MTVASVDYETILQLVYRLPTRQRFALVHDVLQSLEPSLPQRQPTLSQALGLLATTKGAPSDEEVQSWLDEHRVEKYG